MSMKSWESRQELEHRVVLLERQGMSRRAIARALQISRNTVRKILAGHAKKRQQGAPALTPAPKRAPPPSKLEPYLEKVQCLLKDYPDITAQRVFEELCLAGFDGGYTIVKELVRKQRPKPSAQVSLPTPDYGPGKMAESDWADYLVPFTAVPARRMQCFGYVLCHSRRKYFEFFSRKDLHGLMDGHQGAFARFGGVSHRCKYDSQKPVVLRWEGRQPIYNLRFIDFATYYEFRPKACRPKKPNDKPTVERSFWELERSFFNGRSFRDEVDLAAQRCWWLDNVCDQRPQKKRQRRTPLELFAEERDHLVPLPQHPYDTARVVYRVCDVEGFVAWDGNRYSVAYEHVTDLLPVRITQGEIIIYGADLECVARHDLRRKGAGEDVADPQHRPRRDRQGPNLDQLRVTYEVLGEEAVRFLVGLEQARPHSTAYHARHILALRQRYATADLVNALRHALDYGAYEHHAIEAILLARAQPRRLDEYVAEATLARLEQVLGESQTEPRALSEYDDLPCWSSGAVSQEPVNEQEGEVTNGDEQAPPCHDETPNKSSPQ